MVKRKSLGRRHLQKREFGKPARKGKRAVLFEFGVTADDKFFFGAGGGDVEQAVVFERGRRVARR